MEYKLIFIEGLPGTGKTTLSEKILELFTKQGRQAELLQEGDKIPSNFNNIAGIPKAAFVGFQNDINPIIKTENYVFVDLEGCKEETANRLRRYDMGDAFNPNISASEYTHCTLEWWQYWVNNHIKEAVLILDSAFLQCPINEMIFRKASDSQINTYIQAIAEIIKPFNPCCIYLRRENADISIDFAKAVKGEHWAKRVEKLLDELGCPDVFERRFDLEQTFLLLIPNTVCNINGRDWSDAEIKIQALMSRRLCL
jgi:hypothetical protein